MTNKGILYIVPTPIGNLEDITLRAIRILKEVDYIAAEDTRVTKKLLTHYEITNKNLIAYHDHNEQIKSTDILKLLNENKSIALVSDAGTPCISDPGYRLISLCRANDIKVIALPGANAAITAISASGFPTDSFSFFGFPPHKKGRKTFIENAFNKNETVIIYESSHRILKFLEQAIEYGFANRQILIAREISKIYEEYIFDSVDSLSLLLKQNVEKQKGEFVVVIKSEKG